MEKGKKVHLVGNEMYDVNGGHMRCPNCNCEMPPPPHCPFDFGTPLIIDIFANQRIDEKEDSVTSAVYILTNEYGYTRSTF